ncbi:MAG: threonylcarbamoyl-AMP synthase [Chloroflexi bacterium]|nr:threonylcarbamoyl-AMP synthase [Chloroflexota bacterium]
MSAPDAPAPSIVPLSDPDWEDRAVAALEAQQLVGVPTETVYGLAALTTDAALAALIAAKGRSAAKGITLALAWLDQAEAFAVVDDAARRLAHRFWPGPLTMVLPVAPGTSLPTLLTGDGESVGVRLPDHPVPRRLAGRLGPLALTSANLSGQPAALDARSVVAALEPFLALVVDGGPVRGGLASTVVRLGARGDRAGGDRSVEFLRDGPISRALILQALGPPSVPGEGS